MSTGINSLEALVMPGGDNHWTNWCSNLKCYELLVLQQNSWAEKWWQGCECDLRSMWPRWQMPPLSHSDLRLHHFSPSLRQPPRVPLASTHIILMPLIFSIFCTSARIILFNCKSSYISSGSTLSKGFLEWNSKLLPHIRRCVSGFWLLLQVHFGSPVSSAPEAGFFLCLQHSEQALPQIQYSCCSISFPPRRFTDHPIGHWNLYLNISSQSPLSVTLNSVPCIFIFHFTSLYLALYPIVIYYFSSIFQWNVRSLRAEKFLVHCKWRLRPW